MGWLYFPTSRAETGPPTEGWVDEFHVDEDSE